MPFSAFRDVDSDIVNSVNAKLSSASDSENDNSKAELDDVPCPSVAETARALDVLQLFAEKRGLMNTLASHLDGFETALVAESRRKANESN